MAPRTRHRCLPLLKACALLLLAFISSRAPALDPAAMQAMVIVEGEVGRGSAFVVKMDGKTYLVTNSHVVRGNRNVKFKSLRNTELTAGALEIADQVDAVRAELPGAANTLELEPDIEKLKIGDEVIVAGNSEGEGVVREIPGKVVGIGPDRIEVDAQFVPGNSGSPILLKSTGKVIGIATYAKIPRGRAGAKSPFSLNEVRRFGYRLDTVAKWIKPPAKDRLAMEGVKLAEIESLRLSISNVLGANAAFVTKMGVSGFVPKDKAQQFPAFAALAKAIEDFGKNQAAAKTDDDRTKNAADFFAKLKGIVSDDVHGLDEKQFSGFYSLQLKEALAGCQEFYDWYDGTTMPAFRESWLTSRMDSLFVTGIKPAAPPIDPDKVKLVLTDRVAPNEPPDNCHHVTYPPNTQPANLENIFWIIEDPKGQQRSFAMHRTSLRVRTFVSGTYRVYVEYRGPDKRRTISNVAEVKFDGPIAGVTPAPATPATPAAPEKPAPPVPGAPAPAKSAPSSAIGNAFANSLGMKFARVAITGGPTDGRRVLFSVWPTRVQDYAEYARARGITPEKPGFEQSPVHPVVLVNWDDAKSFCAWLTAMERASGKIGPQDEYRLPSDHEWSCAVGLGRLEKAEEGPEAKSGKLEGYPWGNDWPPPEEAGNYGADLQVDEFQNTSPVGSFGANQNGLYDMGGNVDQWCEDWYDLRQTSRVSRSASWKETSESRLRTSRRFRDHPEKRHDYTGFRCVLALSGP